MSNVKVHEFMSNVNVYMLVAVFYLRCDRNLFKFSVLYNKISSIFFQKDNKFLLTTANCFKNRIWWTILSTGICQYPWEKKLELSIVSVMKVMASELVLVNVWGAQESIPPAFLAWQAGTTNRVVVPARQARNRFLAP